jgi:serine-type D-Ala-D-Ala carboxypeptidase (penicillin-binding protein 5/6)
MELRPQRKARKKYNLVNIISAVLILVSVLAWLSFLPSVSAWRAENFAGFLGKKVENAEKRQLNSDESPKDQTKEAKEFMTFDQMVISVPDAPEKDPEFGDTYMRATSAIAIDADAGTILHYQNGNRRMAIASLTKVMTAIVAIENITDLNKEIVTIDEEIRFTEGTRVGCPRSGYCISNRLQLDEKISARALLEAMLMNSANDAAVALAKHISGSQVEFAKLMNKKAHEIGLSDSNFCNPSGLDEEDKPGGCYSTAYDFARISAYALKHPLIWEIMKYETKDIYSADGKIAHTIINTDLLLGQLPNVIGGKTGFTYEAGKSLMMTVHHPEDEDKKVIVVVLDDEYRWEDMKKMFSWVFQAYNWPKK